MLYTSLPDLAAPFCIYPCTKHSWQLYSYLVETSLSITTAAILNPKRYTDFNLVWMNENRGGREIQLCTRVALKHFEPRDQRAGYLGSLFSSNAAATLSKTVTLYTCTTKQRYSQGSLLIVCMILYIWPIWCCFSTVKSGCISFKLPA